MIKKGMVLKIVEEKNKSYIEVFFNDFDECSKLENSFKLNGTPLVHDCTSCNGCVHFFSKEDSSVSSKTLKVLNKSHSLFSLGDVVDVYINNFLFFIQLFFLIILPILSFLASFLFFYYFSYPENISILVSFFALLFVVFINTFFIKKVFKDVFMPYV